MTKLTASAAGESVTIDYDLAVQPFPVVEFDSIRQGNEDIDVTLLRYSASVSSPVIVHLKAGLYEFSDFNNSNYGIICTNLLLQGDGKDVTILQIRENSSTKAAGANPGGGSLGNPYTLLRMYAGDWKGAWAGGFTLSGTQQPKYPSAPAEKGGHNYSGWTIYKGSKNGIVKDVKVTGCPGDWNSPSGETFQLNWYDTVNMLGMDIEVDGYTWKWTSATTKVKGPRVGGSPMGTAGSDTVRWIRVNTHDSRVSSLTSSYAGSSGNPTNGFYTEDAIADNNSNHQNAQGQRFTGINHEQTIGAVKHVRPVTILGPELTTLWDAAHYSLTANLPGTQIAEIIDPVWGGGYTKYNGCLAVKLGITYSGISNTVPVPKVTVNGKELLPFTMGGAPTAAQQAQLDPSVYYVLIRQ